MLLNKHDDIAVYLLRLWAYFVVEVGTIKRTFELQSFANAQVFLNVGAHFIGSRGRKGYHRRLSDTRNGGSDITILGAEVVSPLRDTMRFVYGIERNLYRLQKFHILIFTQRFGSNV